MESVMKVGRTLGDGVYRAAGAVARGARRILSAIPLLGIAPPEFYDDPKNVDDDYIVEGGEEAEGAEGGAAAVSSPPAEEKSTVSSPTEKEKSEEAVEATSEPAKPEEKKSPSKAAAAAAAASVASSPVEEKKDDNTTPAPTPVPTEANKTEDNQKEVEPAKADKTVESKPEIEAPVENNVNAAEDISTTEVNDEAPMSPPPAVPAEAPAPILGPAITEDVASVTKAIEEIDINEKAVAAAVNENIESINSTNEIIADMNHQNNMNE